jgi:hypothetical protein
VRYAVAYCADLSSGTAGYGRLVAFQPVTGTGNKGHCVISQVRNRCAVRRRAARSAGGEVVQ